MAGRDFLHETRCLSCWQGPEGPPGKKKPKSKGKACAPCAPAKEREHLGADGGLRGCDFCPAAYHLSCIGMSQANSSSFGGWALGLANPNPNPNPNRNPNPNQADSSSFGGWACPHHACSCCARKAAAAGGLLFRCTDCPKAYCEDHLPPQSELIGGEVDRLLALGFQAVKQACYVICS